MLKLNNFFCRLAHSCLVMVFFSEVRCSQNAQVCCVGCALSIQNRFSANQSLELLHPMSPLGARPPGLQRRGTHSRRAVTCSDRTLCAWFSDRAVLAFCIDSSACASRTSGQKGLEAAVSSTRSHPRRFDAKQPTRRRAKLRARSTHHPVDSNRFGRPSCTPRRRP